MKNFIFLMAGAIFLFVSCQSDDLQIDDSFKPDHATKVKKDFKIKNYAGEIIVDFIPGDPPSGTGDFLQIGVALPLILDSLLSTILRIFLIFPEPLREFLPLQMEMRSILYHLVSNVMTMNSE